jgi:hypothetical protein
MNNTKFAVFITIFACIGLRTGYYTVVGRGKIIQLLKKHHNITVGYRWVGECLRFLEQNGYIMRRYRYDNSIVGWVKQFSSILTPTIKGAKFLIKRRVEGASLVLKNILAWINKRDKRFPTREDYIKDKINKMNLDEKRRLGDLAEMVFKSG